MAQARYTRDHEYIRLEGDLAIVGVSDYAQAQLGDVVYVELPALGDKIVRGAQVAVVESVKTASEVFSPASGEVVAINDTLDQQPGLVNEDALEAGWMFKLRLADKRELDELMDDDAYQEFLKTLA
jgi:glycine cleavage system H protein